MLERWAGRPAHLPVEYIRPSLQWAQRLLCTGRVAIDCGSVATWQSLALLGVLGFWLVSQSAQTGMNSEADTQPAMLAGPASRALASERVAQVSRDPD